MANRATAVLKGLCLVFALGLAWQWTQLRAAKDPLADLDSAPAMISPNPSRGDPKPTGSNTNAPSASAKKTLDLPKAVLDQAERIHQSGILGSVPKPLPMALLGIGGRDALLRAPNGQTGLVRVGEELGGMKLVSLGTNRVLVEHEGQQKELTLFSGFGGSTLLPQPIKDSP